MSYKGVIQKSIIDDFHKTLKCLDSDNSFLSLSIVTDLCEESLMIKTATSLIAANSTRHVSLTLLMISASLIETKCQAIIQEQLEEFGHVSTAEMLSIATGMAAQHLNESETASSSARSYDMLVDKKEPDDA